jgi:hypothetical protein
MAGFAAPASVTTGGQAPVWRCIDPVLVGAAMV